MRPLERFHLAPKGFKLRASVSLEYKLVGGTSRPAFEFTILALVRRERGARDTVSFFCVRGDAPFAGT